MKESDFLKNFAKILNVEDKLKEIDEKKAKEKQMLEQLGSHLGIAVNFHNEDREVPAILLAKQEVEIIEAIANALPDPVEEENVPEAEPQQEVELITEDVIPPMPRLPEKDIITSSVEKIAKAKPSDMEKVVDKIPDSIRKELDIIKKSVSDFHRFAQRHSQMGGGGAGDVISLDHQTTTVSTSSYNVGRHDYYIGVDYPDNVAIYLPATAKNGRMLVIKDESGSAGFYPITVVGLVDNDPDGFTIKVNNGAVQLIYSNGWRII